MTEFPSLLDKKNKKARARGLKEEERWHVLRATLIIDGYLRMSRTGRLINPMRPNSEL